MFTPDEIIFLLFVWTIWELLVRWPLLRYILINFYRRARVEGTKEHEVVSSTYTILSKIAAPILGEHTRHVFDGLMGREVRNTEDVLDGIDGAIVSNGFQETLDGRVISLAKIASKGGERASPAAGILELIRGAQELMGTQGENGGSGGSVGGRIR